MTLKVIFLVTEDWYFWSHRLSLAKALKQKGVEVLIVTRVNKHGDRIINEGFKLIPIRLVRRSKNIFQEILTLLEIIKIYRRENPNIVHQVAIKPILYGSWAAKFSGVPCVINALANSPGFLKSASASSTQI